MAYGYIIMCSRKTKNSTNSQITETGKIVAIGETGVLAVTLEKLPTLY